MLVIDLCQDQNYQLHHQVYHIMNINEKIPNFISENRKGPRPCFTHIKRIYTRTYQFIYIDSHTDILYYCTQLVQMNCTSVNTTHVHCTLYMYTAVQPTYTHLLLVVHILCLDQLYCCTITFLL